MFDWIGDHGTSLNVLINLGMLLVWLVYLQLLLVAFRRQRRSKILINRGAGEGMDARCLISNMGPEPIYVESLVSTVRLGSEDHTAAITDIAHVDGETASSVRQATHQGPLRTAEFLDLGAFQDLVERTLSVAGARGEAFEVQSLDLTVIAAYGSDDTSVAARRSFVVLDHDGQLRLAPRTMSTEQLRSRRQRNAAERMLSTYG